MENVKISANDVKKDLYKSKVNAKLSHYTSGNLYYTVQLADGTYQFPISTIENNSLISIETLVKARIIELENKLDITLTVKDKSPEEIEIQNEIDTLNKELEKMTRLSSDLGTTDFSNEMKGSDLNRWIAKAIEKDEFIKIK